MTGMDFFCSNTFTMLCKCVCFNFICKNICNCNYQWQRRERKGNPLSSLCWVEMHVFFSLFTLEMRVFDMLKTVTVKCRIVVFSLENRKYWVTMAYLEQPFSPFIKRAYNGTLPFKGGQTLINIEKRKLKGHQVNILLSVLWS